MGMMEFMADMALERERERYADGERIVEFCDAMELIVTNTCFKRQKNKLATYVSGGTVSVIYYLLLRGCDQ